MVLTPSRSRNRDLQSDRRAANQRARVSGLRPIRAAHATKTRPASGLDKAVMENGLACSGDINSAISYAFKTLGYDRPTLEQERAIREFVSGRDIFVISPTGSGKRLCFVALPLVFDHIGVSSGTSPFAATINSTGAGEPPRTWTLSELIVFSASSAARLALSTLEKQGLHKYRRIDCWVDMGTSVTNLSMNETAFLFCSETESNVLLPLGEDKQLLQM